MLKNIVFVLVLVLVLVLAAAKPAFAETAYVTDLLQLDMYAEEAMTGSPILRLRSGDQMEVLERNSRYARVSAKGSQGWVKSLYLVTEEPARARASKLERANEGLEETVKGLRAQLTTEQDKLSTLSESQSGGAEQLATTEADLQKVQQEQQRLEQKLDSYAGSVPLNWLLIGVVIALVGGLVGGWYFVDKRSRARHGGYRVY